MKLTMTKKCYCYSIKSQLGRASSQFYYNLAERFGERGFSRKEFRLTMTRGEIGNYLGLTVETISRLCRFKKAGFIKVEGKFITILDQQALAATAAIKM